MENFSYSRAAALIAILLLPALVAFGCGGGGDDDASGSASLTKAEFLKQADAICQRGVEKYPAEFEAYAKENNLPPREPASYAQQEKLNEAILIPTLKNQAEEIDELSVPAGEEAQVNPIVGGFLKALAEAEDEPSSLVDPLSPLAEVAKLGRKYGLKVCLSAF